MLKRKLVFFDLCATITSHLSQHTSVYEVTDTDGQRKVFTPERCVFGNCLSPKFTNTYSVGNTHMGRTFWPLTLRYVSTYVDDNAIIGADLSALTEREQTTVDFPDASKAYRKLKECCAANRLQSALRLYQSANTIRLPRLLPSCWARDIKPQTFANTSGRRSNSSQVGSVMN